MFTKLTIKARLVAVIGFLSLALVAGGAMGILGVRASNGRLEAASFLAIILGNVAGGLLLEACGAVQRPAEHRRERGSNLPGQHISGVVQRRESGTDRAEYRRKDRAGLIAGRDQQL